MSTAARSARTLLALALALLLPHPGRAEGGPQVVERRYQLSFLNAAEATAIAQNLCPTEGRCSVGSMGQSMLLVTADSSTQGRIGAALRTADVPPAAQAFQLILLEAHRGGSGTPEGLPASARKALADVAEFLPFGRFDLIAPIAFIRTTHDARLTVAHDAELSYELSLSFRGDPRQPGAELLIDTFRLRLIPAEPILVALAAQPGYSAGAQLPRRSPPGGGSAAPAPAPAAAVPGGSGTPAPAPPSTPRPSVAEELLGTSFSIHKGETVVVGTSKLEGNDRALVVLLTALP
ncbi:MAG TPA: hypothetical protein VGV61_14450 [Thermoanaerobaculia bacterium]|jgi:hypothetical protein|nr:hypothetical protein [Thermoanaerobaculia bacterium]